jgi:glycosyltransferase involved in cell wall biosynthesis
LSRKTVALDARLAGGTNTGDSSYWSGLLYGLSRQDSDLQFLLFSNAAKPEGIPDSPKFSWITVPSRSGRWWSYVLFPLVARRMGAGAIHTQYSLSPLAGDRGITTIHDVSFMIGPEWFKPRDRLILSRTVPSSVRRARKVIAVSNTCRDEIEHFLPAARGKVVPIYNGLPPWVHRIEDPSTMLHDLNVEQPYLLTVGTRWPRKNMGLAVEAAAQIEGARLVVTGKAGWGEETAGSHVQTVGYVSNKQLCALYSGAALYLAPSKHEGFGIPVIEAFACGCPVVCSSGGALPEVAGDAAMVQQTWDPGHWAETIRSLLGDSGKLQELRRRGLERVKKFDWVESAKQTVDVYREVLV